MRRFPDTLLLVDLVSYIAGAPVDFDANAIDFAFAVHTEVGRRCAGARRTAGGGAQ